MKPLRIAIVGQHELDYPRNVTNQRILASLGHELALVHSRDATPVRMAKLVAGTLREANNVDAIFMTEGSHMYVPFVAPIARVKRTPLIFDAFTSKYNTYVEDRKTYNPGSFGALRCHWMDAASVANADHCVFDTHEHAAYFARRYRLRGGSHVIEVAVDEETFLPATQEPPAEHTLRVLFYGSYIPLQGVEHIVDAARLLQDEPFAFTLIGRGQTFESTHKRAEGLTNLTFVDPVTPAGLVSHMHAFDVCLGIFGDTEKAGNVVANKVVQAAACARPLVTRRSSAVERYFAHERDVMLVDAANPKQIADTLRALRETPALRQRLARQARATFDAHFSVEALSRKMTAVLEAAVGR